jgi:hypothetical protein
VLGSRCTHTGARPRVTMPLGTADNVTQSFPRIYP